MNTRKYQKMVDNLTPKENKLTNMFISFFSGGIIGLIGTFLYLRLNNTYNEELSISFMLLILLLTLITLAFSN